MIRFRQIMKPAAAILFLCLLSLDSFAGSNKPVRARKGMVVSSHILASQVGVEVLKNGGNAVDAAVATGMALAVVLPGAGNIGGGGFMIVYSKDGTVTAFDFREKAPAAAHARMYVDSVGNYVRNLNHDGYLSVGVPGTVAGFDLALKKFGTKSWKELTEPAVRLADRGFPVTWGLADDLADLKEDLLEYPASKRSFFKRDTLTYEADDIWKQPDLAKTLKRIQSKGRDGFYRGETARLIAADMKKNGGLITEADLAAYEAKERTPLHGTYKGYDVYSMPPPSSGGTALIEMLNILEGFDLKSYGHNSATYLHLLTEAMRHAYADRARHLGDPDFNPDIPIERLTSKEYAEEIRRGISLSQASKIEIASVAEAQESEETTHYSVVDAEGNAVVVTYTLEYWFGSRIVADGLGFLYNNEMGDFNPVPGFTDSTGKVGTPANIVAPGKRMLSSMTPTIIAKDGKPWMLIGSPGGRTIMNTVLQVVLNVVDFKMNIAEAISAGRIHHQWMPDEVRLEPYSTTMDSKRLLDMLGHRNVRWRGYQGRAMGIIIDPETGLRLGASDPRDDDGAAIGY
ncbi:MAG: gamma-glutamyltransferase [Ignavibacteriae bacterium]|nr:gamma-glutamyltransferase [Ignavibacteriota bacterium]